MVMDPTCEKKSYPGVLHSSSDHLAFAHFNRRASMRLHAWLLKVLFGVGIAACSVRSGPQIICVFGCMKAAAAAVAAAFSHFVDQCSSWHNCGGSKLTPTPFLPKYKIR